MRRLTPRERLENLLLDEGFVEITLRDAKGHWRTSKYADVYRWEGVARRLINGVLTEVSLASWETMTYCARHGIEIGRGDGDLVSDFLVHGKTAKLAKVAPSAIHPSLSNVALGREEGPHGAK